MLVATKGHRILGDRLVSVQNQYSPAVRDSEAELQLCADLGLAFLPWNPLGGISRSSLDGPSRSEGEVRFGAKRPAAPPKGARGTARPATMVPQTKIGTSRHIQRSAYAVAPAG
ncbi:hypothetical protein GCM10022403_058320 [Streptomyces coacervatus]|uniref:NADP-dependent oxidoreductase domain-containing protein n=1 Tax=Streptomyces coacervatus TaxID=647381 RepID=A0ABP7IFS2_9ACTN